MLSFWVIFYRKSRKRCTGPKSSILKLYSCGAEGEFATRGYLPRVRSEYFKTSVDIGMPYLIKWCLVKVVRSRLRGSM